jgi:hypothetical protein
MATQRSHVNGLKNAQPSSNDGVLCAKIETEPL